MMPPMKTPRVDHGAETGRIPQYIVWVLALGLAACLIGSAAAQTATDPWQAPGNPRSYEVLGERYEVLDSAAGYVERGVASWSGDKFHGNPTASGETYDMHALTAAHRTLPIPTDVQVTNLRNGKSIVVRVNDRGPFRHSRIIDLSYAAARELDLVGAGTGLVEVRAIETAEVALRRAPAIFLQVGAYSRRANAERLRARLEASGFDDVAVHEESIGGRQLARVRLGPITDAAIYDRLLERLAGLGIPDVFVARDRHSADQGPAAR